MMMATEVMRRGALTGELTMTACKEEEEVEESESVAWTAQASPSASGGVAVHDEVMYCQKASLTNEAAAKHMMMMTEARERGVSDGEVVMTACRVVGVARRSRWRKPWWERERQREREKEREGEREIERVRKRAQSYKVLCR